MRAEAIAITDAIAKDMVPVPADAGDVCPMCRSWRDLGRELCNNCEQATQDLTSPCRTVLPICLYSKPSVMRDRMTFYKDDTDERHARYAADVAAILGRFFAEHGVRLTATVGDWDVACVVPSESRQPPHPLEVALTNFPSEHLRPVETLLERHTGAVGHRKLSDDAYRAIRDIGELKVLIIDDVYTTGARSQSAASALTMAGATVRAIVPIARRVNPDFNPGVAALWQRQMVIPFSFTSLPWWSQS